MTENKGNYRTRFKLDPNKEPVQSPVAVALPLELDKYVRSQPNRSEWLRNAIARQVEEDLKNAS